MTTCASRDSAGPIFEATIWSTILKLQDGEEDVRAAALGRLLERYRKPILKHIQLSQRCTPEQAEDLTHDFVVQCVRLNSFAEVGPERGRFRTFLKICIRNFLRDRHDRDCAEKRGGGRPIASLDETDADGTAVHVMVGPSMDLERILDREWALKVLDNALERLRMEYQKSRQLALFEALKGQLGRAPQPGTSAEVGRNLGMSEGAVNTALNRMRKELARAISQEVMETVGSRADWREELRYLVELLGSA